MGGPRLRGGASFGEGGQGAEVGRGRGREDRLQRRLGRGGIRRGPGGVAAGHQRQSPDAGQVERRRGGAGDRGVGLDRPAVDGDALRDAGQVGDGERDGAGFQTGTGAIEIGGGLSPGADVGVRDRGGLRFRGGGRDLARERRRPGEAVAEGGGARGRRVGVRRAFRDIERPPGGGVGGSRRRGRVDGGHVARLGGGERFGGHSARVAGGRGFRLGVRQAAGRSVVVIERLRRGVAFQRRSALGAAGGLEPALVEAGGSGRALGLGEGVGAGPGGGRVGGAGQFLPDFGAFGKGLGEIVALGIEPREVVAQRGGLVLGAAPAAAGPRPSGGGGDGGEAGFAADRDRIHPAAAGDRVELARDRGEEIAADPRQPVLFGLLRRVAALGLQPEHALADPEELGRAVAGDPVGDPRLGLVVLGEDATGGKLGHAGEGACEPALGDAVAGATDLDLGGDLRDAAGIGAERARLGAAGAVGDEEQRLQRFEDRRLPGLVGGGDEVQPVAEAVEGDGGAGEAADVRQADRAELHAASPAKA